VVVDAIDDMRNKCLLLTECVRRGLAVVTAGGAGGRRDPTAVRTADLGCATHDRLLREVRRVLRRDHGFPTGEGVDFKVACVYSIERVRTPEGGACGGRKEGPRCDLDYGSLGFVTAAFGLALAGWAVERIARGEEGSKPV
jgi:tRNA threonylcarbamoyladenosine dehydratase